MLGTDDLSAKLTALKLSSVSTLTVRLWRSRQVVIKIDLSVSAEGGLISSIKWQNEEHHYIPDGMADHVYHHRIVFEVNPAPEKPAYQGGQDEHNITCKDMDTGVEN